MQHQIKTTILVSLFMSSSLWASSTPPGPVTTTPDNSAQLAQLAAIQNAMTGSGYTNGLSPIAQQLINYYDANQDVIAPGIYVTSNSGAKALLYQSPTSNIQSNVVTQVAAQVSAGLQQSSSNPQAAFYNNHMQNYQQSNADLTIESLLGQVSIPNQTAAQQAIVSVLNPFPAGIDYNTLMNSGQSTESGQLDANGQAIVANTMAQQAMLSVPANSFYQMLAARTPIPNLPSSENSVDSLLTVLQRESSWRFLNNGVDGEGKAVDWYKNLNTVSTEAILREIAMMQAFQLYMDFQKYQQNERMEALLATFTAAQGRLSAVMNQVAQQLQQQQTQAEAAKVQMQSTPSISDGDN